MKKYTVFLLAAFAILISVAAYNANAADNASSITDVCDVDGTDYKSESWSNEQYPVIDLFGEKEVPLFTTNGNISNIHVNKLAKLILDNNETHTLRDGEKLDLGNGYALEAKQININNEEIWFEFSKDGKYITDQIVSASNEGNRTWTVTLDNVQGENNVVVMKVHIKNLFLGSETRVVWIDGIWLTDYTNATTLKVGDKIGEFTLKKIVSGVNTSNMGSLVFENTTGSSVACNVVGTNYKCDSWSNVTADTANIADNVSNITDICNVVDTSYKWASNEQYPVIDLFGEKEVPLFTTNGSIGNTHVNKLAKLILDNNETYTIIDSYKLDLGNGYALEVKQINVDNEEIWFEFSKDGKYITDQIVPVNTDSNKTWTVTLDNVQGENNVVVMKVHVDELFVGAVDNIVRIDGLWLIDYANTTTLKVGDKIGEFTLENIVSGVNASNMGSLVFENTTGSSVACNVVGTSYKCGSWSNAAADTANTADIANTEDNVSNITDVCNVVSTSYKWVSNEQYPVIDLFGDKYVPLFNTNESIWDAHVDKLAKLIIDSNERHVLKDGEKLDLGQGYALEAKQISIPNQQAWLEFTKDGKYIDDRIVTLNDDKNTTWNVTLNNNIQGENNVIVMRVHVDGVSGLVENNILQYSCVSIDGIWLTDYSNVRNLKIGDKIGEFTLEEIISGENISNQGSLVFKNATGSSISCNVVGTNYKCDSWSNQYPSINLFGEKYFPLLANSDPGRKPHNDPIWECHIDKLAKLVLNSDEKHLLKTGEKLDLGQGYSLQVKQIDVEGNRALIEFDKDGKYVDDTIVLTDPNEHYWTCLRDNIQGEDNIPVLKIYVSKVYQEGSDSIVQIDGIWLIDYVNARTLKIGDKIGESTLEKIVSGTNSSNLGSLAFEKTQDVDSSSPASEEEPVVSTNKSTGPFTSWHLNFWKFLTGKDLETEEPNSTTTSGSTV